ncbi:PEP-CTERM sorting domain-containing protein [Limihaloglobus sulfuriphilus]|nr:PEP-CTERM sorting domain-containing protein [Limihaloglobus sulfuriphilus]
MSVVLTFSAGLVQAAVLHGTLTEWHVPFADRSEVDHGCSNLDTYQATDPAHLTEESMVWNNPGGGGWIATDGPMWGGLTTLQAIKDAGDQWWAFNGNTTIGVDGVGDGYVSVIWESGYDSSPAYTGRELDQIDILVGNGPGDVRVNYKFMIESLAIGETAWTPITDGFLTSDSNATGTVSKISITDIGLENTSGVRIIANGLTQADGNWAATDIVEVDINLVPEPATMVLLGLGGLLVRKRLA